MQIKNQISFKAQYVACAKIKNKEKCPHQLEKVDIIELSSFDENDVETVDEFSKNWKQNISSAYYRVFVIPQPSLKTHYYALTLPQDTYYKSNPENILGICTISERANDVINIDFLQTNPKYMYSNKKNQKYTNIGTAFINFLKEQYPTKKIRLLSTQEAMGFYLKNNFIPLGNRPNNPCMMWNA